MKGRLLVVMLLAGFLTGSFAESCYPVNTPKMVFSPYLPIGNKWDDIETSIDFHCAPAFQGNQLHVSVSVQDSASTSVFQLRNAVGDTLRYGLFIDPARSVPLTSNMGIPLRDVNSSTKTFSVVLYGRIYPNQRTAGVGQYRGFLNLQLNY